MCRDSGLENISTTMLSPITGLQKSRDCLLAWQERCCRMEEDHIMA